MIVQDLQFATLEQLFQTCLFTEDNVLQLSPGPLNFSSTQVDLGGILLEWNRTGATIRSREIYRGAGLMFGFVLHSPKPLKSFGYDLDYGHAVVWHPDVELDYVAPRGLSSLIIHVEAALVDVLGWIPGGGAWRRVPSQQLHKLEATCHLATQAAREDTAAAVEDGLDPDMRRALAPWRDRILAELERALAPWLTQSAATRQSAFPGTSQFRRFREAEDSFAHYDLGQPLAVDAMAEALGVARRSLFHAFRTSIGLGPYAYLQLIRLHRLRHRLLATSITDTTVTEVASQLGFSHMGRLAEAYREHFGERPSDTLRRS